MQSAAGEILERVDGNRTLLSGLRATFESESAQLLHELRLGTAEKNSASVRRAGHTLRGMLSFFSASDAEWIIRQLEENARTGLWTGLEEMVDHLTEEIQRVNDEVARLCR